MTTISPFTSANRAYGKAIVTRSVEDGQSTYESPRQIRVLGEPDELEGGALLPGLRIPLARLFPA
jgi:hypothetical protein